MTDVEWQEIINEKIRGLYPRAPISDGMLAHFGQRRLRFFPEQMVRCAINDFALESPDSVKGLLLAIERYCRRRQAQEAPAEYDRHGISPAERRNIINAIRGKDHARFDGWPDNAIYDEWLKQEGYLRYETPEYATYVESRQKGET